MLVWLLSLCIRLLVPFLILFLPGLGSILGILADMTDIVVLDTLGAPSVKLWYNQFDKLLDFYLYCFMAFQAWKQWSNKLAKNTAVALLFFRGIGVVLFELFPARFLLFVFPNVFVWFYLFHLFSTRVFKKDYIKNYRWLLAILVLLTLPKLYQEYLFHVVQIPLYQWFQTGLTFFTNFR